MHKTWTGWASAVWKFAAHNEMLVDMGHKESQA